MILENILRPESKIAIIYTQPSTETEARKKVTGADEHFLSKSEQGFLSKLSGSGIDIDKCSILTVVRNRYYNQSARFPDGELDCWYELLSRDLHKLSPNIIIACGEIPTAFFLQKRLTYNKTGLVTTHSERMQGYVFDSCYGKVISVAGITNADWAVPSWHPMMQWNLGKGKRNADTPSSLSKQPTVHVTNDMELLKRIFLDADFQASPTSLLAFDIECAGMEITCISFARDVNNAYVVPLHHLHPSELAYCLRNIAIILDSPVAKVGQNGNFDILYLGFYYNMPVRNYKFDTMLAMHSMYSNLPKDLNTLGAVFTDEPSWKDDKGWANEVDK